MKISADPKYPGYNPAVAMHTEVYLNGEKMLNCVAADSDAGTAVCYKTGYLKTPGETEIKRGNVCIFVPEEYRGLLAG